jgi:hypothetical protein
MYQDNPFEVLGAVALFQRTMAEDNKMSISLFKE